MSLLSLALISYLSGRSHAASALETDKGIVRCKIGVTHFFYRPYPVKDYIWNVDCDGETAEISEDGKPVTIGGMTMAKPGPERQLVVTSMVNGGRHIEIELGELSEALDPEIYFRGSIAAESLTISLGKISVYFENSNVEAKVVRIEATSVQLIGTTFSGHLFVKANLKIGNIDCQSAQLEGSSILVQGSINAKGDITVNGVDLLIRFATDAVNVKSETGSVVMVLSRSFYQYGAVPVHFSARIIVSISSPKWTAKSEHDVTEWTFDAPNGVTLVGLEVPKGIRHIKLAGLRLRPEDVQFLDDKTPRIRQSAGPLAG